MARCFEVHKPIVFFSQPVRRSNIIATQVVEAEERALRIVAHGMRRAGHQLLMPSHHLALVASRLAWAMRARHRSVIKARKLGLVAVQLKHFPAAPILPVTVGHSNERVVRAALFVCWAVECILIVRVTFCCGIPQTAHVTTTQ